jgi:hypothetical protein
MGPGAFHQSNGCPPAAPQAIAEARHEFQPSGTAANHDDLVERFLPRLVVFADRLRASIRGRRLIIRLAA